MIRSLRKSLSTGTWPEAAGYSGARQLESFTRAFWIVRAYYAVILMFGYQEAGYLWRISTDGSGEMRPLWPVFWASDSSSAATILIAAMIIAGLLAVVFPDRRWARILVFLAFFQVSAFQASFGLEGINHGNHYWLWIGFCFCFLPTGDHRQIAASRRGRFNFLLVFWCTQALIMLFYSMSGVWKIAGALEDLIVGDFSGFHPFALAMIVSQKMLQLDRETVLGPWLVHNPWIGWPLHMWVFYVELVAILVIFRPALHRAWGTMLILFHIGTLVLLGISFSKHVLVLVLLFVWSPFALRSYSAGEMISEVPGIAWLRKTRLGSQRLGRSGKSRPNLATKTLSTGT